MVTADLEATDDGTNLRIRWAMPTDEAAAPAAWSPEQQTVALERLVQVVATGVAD